MSRNGSIACNHPSVNSSYVYGIFKQSAVAPRQDGGGKVGSIRLEHEKGRAASRVFAGSHRAMGEACTGQSEDENHPNPIVETVPPSARDIERTLRSRHRISEVLRARCILHPSSVAERTDSDITLIRETDIAAQPAHVSVEMEEVAPVPAASIARKARHTRRSRYRACGHPGRAALTLHAH